MSDRLTELSARLEEAGCEALLVLARSSQDPDLAPFVGAVHLGECQLVAPRGAAPRLAYLTPMERDEAAATGLSLISPEDLDHTRWQNQAFEPPGLMAWVAARALELSGVRPGRVALAGHGPAGVIQAACARLSRDGWVWVPGNSLILQLRKRKTSAEVAGIRAAAEGTAEAMRAVARLLAAATVDASDNSLRLEGEPLRVERLRAEIGQVLARRGLEQPKGNIVAPGDEGGVPHSTGTPERVLRAGESLVVDLYPRNPVSGLFADCTRTFCVGAPPEPLARAHAAVREALGLSHQRSIAGVRGWELQEAVCEVLGAAGYATPISTPGTTAGYVHNLGHGVGLDLHEQPIFKKVSGAEGVLREGDVFTLEPGLYHPEQGFGVRLEDLAWLGADGLENLTPLPYDLDPRAFL
jgi:Xaa-Pro aminopeptidase